MLVGNRKIELGYLQCTVRESENDSISCKLFLCVKKMIKTDNVKGTDVSVLSVLTFAIKMILK